jgi:hypothetical protein
LRSAAGVVAIAVLMAAAAPAAAVEPPRPSPSPGGARKGEHPLAPFSRAELEKLAPLVALADVACIESQPDGTMKQVTVLTWIAAPPAVVRDVIEASERYKEFIPNLTQSTREPLPDGGWLSVWRMELPVSSFEGRSRFHRDGEAILVRGDDEATYRYETIGSGGGTLLVQYGFVDVKHANAFVRAFVKRQPMMEHGLALSAQLLFVTAMRAEALKRAGAGASEKIAPPKGPAASFDALLARGQVALMRTSAGGSVGDVSVLERIFAPEARVHDVVWKAGQWADFVPGVDKSYARAPGEYQVEMSTPIVSWATAWALRDAPHAIDGAGIAGDLSGARFRWDLSARGEKETLAVYRVRQKLDAGSLILRKLFAHQPSLEYGINVALGLVWMHAIRGRAEGWKP